LYNPLSHAPKTLTVPQATIKEAANRNVLNVYFFYGNYASTRPATFFRLKPNGKKILITSPSVHCPEGRGPDVSMDVIFTGELNPGSTGIVHTGMIRLPTGQSLKIAAKFAFCSADKSVLAKEHALYALMSSKGVKGIPRDYGIFLDAEEDDESEGPFALLMSYAGQSLFRQQNLITRSVK
jgi:hypothetical protein